MKEKTQLRKMEELDAKVDKINYDLIGLENRKKEMEDKKASYQKEIDKLEKEKNSILCKTDTMKPLKKFIYIVVSLRTDLKRVDLINVKLNEKQKEKDGIQNKIDIQNNLYAETIKEKDNIIEQRKELYISQNATKENTQENEKVSKMRALTQIFEITSKFKDSKVMSNLNHLVEKEIDQYKTAVTSKKENIEQKQDQDEME
ncbi:MAG: hypothetical protein ACLR1U_03185 [Clostridia bacterium]